MSIMASKTVKQLIRAGGGESSSAKAYLGVHRQQCQQANVRKEEPTDCFPSLALLR